MYLIYSRQDVQYGGDELLEIVTDGIINDINNFVNSGTGGVNNNGNYGGNPLGDHVADPDIPAIKGSEVQDADLGSNSPEDTTTNNYYTPSQCEFSGAYGIRVYRNGSIVAPRKCDGGLYMLID